MLYLKGYAGDGTLTATQGYIHVGQTRLTVPAYSQALTGEGQGYVLFDPNWVTQVQFAKMVPQPSAVQWGEYNNVTNILDVGSALVIGRFLMDGSNVSEESIVQPISPATFTKEHLMEVLADRGYADMTLWAGALGVAQLFESLAVWDFFADKIKVNTLEISRMVEGELFRFLLVNDNGEGIPEIQAWRGGVKVFYIDAKTGSVYIDGTGEFKGTITHDALKTQTAKEGATTINFSQKTRWSGTSFYEAMNSVATNGTFSDCVTGDTFAKITRLASTSEKALIRSTSTGFLNSSLNFRDICTGTMRTKGTARLEFQLGLYDRYGHADYRLLVNGVQVWFLEVSTGYADWPKYKSITFEFPCVAGTTYQLQAKNDGSISLDYLREYIKGNGVLGYNSESNYTLFDKNGAYAQSVLISSPNSFLSSANHTLASGAGFFAGVSILADGIQFSTDQAISKISYGAKANEPIVGVKRQGGSIVVMYGSQNPDTFEVNNDEGATSGWYEATGAYSILERVEAIITSNIFPKDGTRDIGKNSERFRAGYFNNLYGETLDIENAIVRGQAAYACRAWVVFNGTTTPISISAENSRNIASVVRTNTGAYTIYFTDPMPDTNYAISATTTCSWSAGSSVSYMSEDYGVARYADRFSLITKMAETSGLSGAIDYNARISVIVFR